jgi:hypothetical protein
MKTKQRNIKTKAKIIMNGVIISVMAHRGGNGISKE